MRRFAIPSLVLAVLGASFLTASAQAKDWSGLKGEVYPNFKIEFTRAGKDVKTLKAGTYTIKVEDKAAIHDFHLVGPSVNKTTGVPFVGELTWRVTFKPGKYTFMCDPHASTMRGTFLVTKQHSNLLVHWPKYLAPWINHHDPPLRLRS